jgi:hypothetical protein
MIWRHMLGAHGTWRGETKGMCSHVSGKSGKMGVEL